MPSLYDATAAVGDVSSSNFTTLYNSSGLSAPNTGGGAVSGNLNIGGNLTVQGTSLLQGAVIMGSTLSLPNYTFPTPDGATDMVMVTDGSGNITWRYVQSIPGANYEIAANATTGGANLTLFSDVSSDSVKFASGIGIAVSRTNANTITITNTAPDTNTTYTIDATTTTGGANLNLVGSDATIDTIKFANGTNTTVSRTDDHTITFDAATYNIDAATTTGGALLDLTCSAGGSDSVKFANGRNITVSQTDNNTITISTIADDIPDGTANGQVLVWENGAWTANNSVVATTISGRLTATYRDSGNTNITSALELFRDFDTGTYTTGNSSSVIFGVDSNTQPTERFGLLGFNYSATDPGFFVRTSTDNFSTGTNILTATSSNLKSTATNLTLNYLHTGAPTQNVAFTVHRGSSTDATITWNETTDTWDISNGINVAGPIAASGIISTTAESIAMNTDSTATDSYLNFKGSTQYLKWNNTTSKFELSNGITINGNETVLGTIDATGIISTTAESIAMNTDSTATDSLLNFKGFTQYLKWDNTNSRFQFSDPLYITTNQPAAVFEHAVNNTTPSNVSPVALKVVERVTNAANNDTNNGGAGIMFARTSGSSGGTEKDYIAIATRYNGVDNTANMAFSWSTDNFNQSSPGVFTASYDYLQLYPTYAKFFNESLYVDYTTNGDCLVGVNTASPTFTLDVYGDAHVATQLVVDGDLYVDGTKIHIATPVQGQVLYYDGGQFTNSSNIVSTVAANRTSYEYQNSSAGTNSVLFLRKNKTATNFVSGDGAGLTFQVESTAQGTQTFATLVGVYDATSPSMLLQTSTDNFTTRSTVANFSGTQALLSAETLQLNSLVTGAPSLDSSIIVNRGTSADVSIKWNEGIDRWQDTTDGTNFYNLPNQNLDTNSDVSFSSIQLDGQSTTDTSTITTTATTTVPVATTNRNTMKVLVHLTNNATNAVHCVEALLLRNGSAAMLTTYGEMYSSAALATFTADISAGSLRLLATPATIQSTTISVIVTSLT